MRSAVVVVPDAAEIARAVRARVLGCKPQHLRRRNDVLHRVDQQHCVKRADWKSLTFSTRQELHPIGNRRIQPGNGLLRQLDFLAIDIDSDDAFSTSVSEPSRSSAGAAT